VRRSSYFVYFFKFFFSPFSRVYCAFRTTCNGVSDITPLELVCRICEEKIRADLLGHHTQFCLLVSKCVDVENEDVDKRLRRFCEALEGRRADLEKEMVPPPPLVELRA
jgi:hypothetical protein